jgi:hypothetical protein
MSDSLNLPEIINDDSAVSEHNSNNNFISQLLNMAKQNGGSCGTSHPKPPLEPYDDYQRGGSGCGYPQHGAGCGCNGNDEARYKQQYMKYKAKYLNLLNNSKHKSQSGGSVSGNAKNTFSLDECEQNVRNMFFN